MKSIIIERVNKGWNRLKCFCGFHKWKSDSDSFVGIASQHEVCLFWWYCERCYTSKLKHITR